MCDYDGERPEVWRASLQTARKPYRCDECRRTIQPGERYIRDFMVFDGIGCTSFTCSHCRIARDWMLDNCGSFASGLDEQMVEHAAEYPGIAWGLIRISVGIRREWVRFDRAGLMAVPDMPDSIESVVGESAA